MVNNTESPLLVSIASNIDQVENTVELINRMHTMFRVDRSYTEPLYNYNHSYYNYRYFYSGGIREPIRNNVPFVRSLVRSPLEEEYLNRVNEDIVLDGSELMDAERDPRGVFRRVFDRIGNGFYLNRVFSPRVNWFLFSGIALVLILKIVFFVLLFPF